MTDTVKISDTVDLTGPERTTNVLIVDDRPDNLLALEAALEPLGQNIVRAASGEETLRILLKEEVAVIILDVQMPGLDGFETAAYIKRLDRTKHIPIIFLTAINKEAQHVFRGYTTGAVDYLFKPFDPTVLRSKVQVFIELHQKTKELQASEERFRKSFDHAPIGVALVGVDGSFLKVNRSLCELTRISEEELSAKNVNDLLARDEEAFQLGELEVELSADGHSCHLEKRLVPGRAEEKHALIGISFIPEAASLGPHFIFQITDITERRQLETFRERFVSHAAHELRTPATVIAGTATLLQRSRDKMSQDELDQCITALHRQSQRLTNMVANLLDLARLREGRHAADLQSLDLSRATAQVLEHTAPPPEKSVNVSVTGGIRALVDPEALDHILSNLLVNAYRYGGSTIEIVARREPAGVVLSVGDDGGGVPQDLEGRLFEPFARGQGASSVGGSGLGLALVKSLVEASGGEVCYERSPGGGARFEVRLAAPSPEENAARSGSDASPATVET